MGRENDWSMRSEVKKTLLARWDLSRLSQFGSERFHVVVVVKKYIAYSDIVFSRVFQKLYIYIYD